MICKLEYIKGKVRGDITINGCNECLFNDRTITSGSYCRLLNKSLPEMRNTEVYYRCPLLYPIFHKLDITLSVHSYSVRKGDIKDKGGKMKKKIFERKCLPGKHPRILVSDEFIKRNNLKLQPVVAIKKKIEERKGLLFDFWVDVLLWYLDFDSAKSYLKKDYIEEVIEGKQKWLQIVSIEETAQDFLDYMVFAWRKALDQRGLSALRSINKLAAWLWLMQREDLQEIIEDNNLYNPYGAPALVEVCKRMGIDVPEDVITFSYHKV